MVFINAFCIGIILSGSITFATDQYGDFFYVSDGVQITITGYDGDGGNVLIPSSILDLPVTGIGAYTFYYQNSLTGVSIPNGVVSIGESAFNGCGGLTKITLPSAVTNLGNYAFVDCPILTRVFFLNDPPHAESTVFTSPATVFYLAGTTGWEEIYAGSPTSLFYPGADLAYTVNNDEHVTVTGYLGSGGDLIIPASIDAKPVSGIESLPFPGAGSLTSLSIPATVLSITDEKFVGCDDLESIRVDADNVEYSSLNGVLFDKNRETLLRFPPAGEGHYSVPEGVLAIDDSAFLDSVDLTSITIPSSVTSVGTTAFDGCEKLRTITIDSAAAIEAIEFKDLHITQVIIGSRVSEIADYAFYNCSSLLVVTMGSSVTRIGDFAFYNCTGLASAILPSGVTRIGDYAFYNCVSLTRMAIPAEVTQIGNYAFYSCRSLQRVYFSGNAPTHGYFPFSGGTLYYLPGTTGWGDIYANRPAVLWNPQITEPEMLPDSDGFAFTIIGTPDIPISIETSETLPGDSWQPLHVGTLSKGNLEFTHPDALERPVRYYRITAP